MKTTKYRRRCFDQIEGIVTENKALTEEVDRFRLEAEKVAMERAAQEERMVDLSRRLADKDTEHRSKTSDWHQPLCAVSCSCWPR